MNRGMVFLLGLAMLLVGQAMAKSDEKSEAAAFDYVDYAAVLKQVDEKGLVDYRRIQDDPNSLNRFLQSLSQLSPKRYESWSKDQQLAFWINAYNGLTLAAIVDHYPIKSNALKSLAFPKNSILQIKGVWKKLTFKVMGRDLTLDHIEHGIIRKEFTKPQIHMALVCAALSCPTLRSEPYRTETLESQFEDQARHFASDSKRFKIDRTKKVVYLSKIFKWFGKDFVDRFLPESGFQGHSSQKRASLNFMSLHLNDAGADYLRTQTYRVKYLDYDWSLNEKSPKTIEDS